MKREPPIDAPSGQINTSDRKRRPCDRRQEIRKEKRFSQNPLENVQQRSSVPASGGTFSATQLLGFLNDSFMICFQKSDPSAVNAELSEAISGFTPSSGPSVWGAAAALTRSAGAMLVTEQRWHDGVSMLASISTTS